MDLGTSEPAVPDPPAVAPLLDTADRRRLGVLIGLIVLMSMAIAHQATSRIERLGYGSPDDAMYLQFLHNTGAGDFGHYTMDMWEEPFARNYLASHGDFSFVAQLPVFFLVPSTGVLLFLQALTGLSAAIPLFLFARRNLGSSNRALAIAGLLLIFPLLDYNLSRLGQSFWLTPLPLFWALERLDADRKRASGIFFGIAMLTREDTALPILAFLLPLALTNAEHRRFALLVSGCALAWMLVYLLGIKPSFDVPGPQHFSRFSHLADGTLGLLFSPLLKPTVFFGSIFQKQPALLALLLILPLGPALWLSPRHLLVASAPMVVLAVSSVSSDRVLGHYMVPTIPFLFFGLVVGLARLREWSEGKKIDLSLYGMVAAGFLTAAAWGTDVGLFKHYQPIRSLSLSAIGELEAINPEFRQVNAWADSIPQDASVSASTVSLVLVAQRREVYPFPVRRDAVDFLLVDRGGWQANWPPIEANVHEDAVQAALAEPGVTFEMTSNKRWLLIDRRGAQR